MNTFEIDNKYIAQTYKRFPVTLVEGKGSLAYDDKGKEYIDLAGGIAVNIFGYCDEAWQSAVCAQAGQLSHTSNLYYTQPASVLAKLLVEKSKMSRVFFGNSGAEANECAIKLARKYSQDKYGEARHKILCLKNSFHGRTLTTLAATGQDVFHKDFKPLTPGFVHCEPTKEALNEALKDENICAIMMETIQGEGGINVLSKEFVHEAYYQAQKRDIILIVDEIQTGLGRTGEFFDYMNYSIYPDIVTVAKGLGGGLPIGACIFGKKLENTFAFGDHGSTFGGNPIACAGALSVVERIDEEVFEGVKVRNKIITDSISISPKVKEITGRGLMLGIEISGDVDKAVAECLENGVLVIKAKNKIRLLPALNIPFPQLTKALAVLIKAINES
ncbi:MAG: acetylornithine/succinylornithine family transaminase [Christensenellaceae bacterium]|nr:acetylornithine/succinylornithine family transaminase [Christensenellaceae bacterium]